jgi:hypothetical protein
MDGTENTILSEVRSRKPKATSSLICGIEAQYKHKQYYEKQETLRVSH